MNRVRVWCFADSKLDSFLVYWTSYQWAKEWDGEHKRLNWLSSVEFLDSPLEAGWEDQSSRRKLLLLVIERSHFWWSGWGLGCLPGLPGGAVSDTLNQDFQLPGCGLLCPKPLFFFACFYHMFFYTETFRTEAFQHEWRKQQRKWVKW